MDLLAGAIDLHVHAGPDIVERADDLATLCATAHDAGLAALVLKDHNTSTVGRVDALNRLRPGPTRFVAGLALNPAVGGVNPLAVEAALRCGAAIIWLPTFGAAHHLRLIRRGGPGLVPPAPWAGWSLDLADADLLKILDLVAAADAILATGHLAPEEIFRLLPVAQARGVKRLLITHANEIVPGLSIAEQRDLVRAGAWIEHSFLGCTACAPGARPFEEFVADLQALGPERLIISSDFGQPANGPVIAGFRSYLERLLGAGVPAAVLRDLIAHHPRTLLDGANGVRLP